MPIKTAIVSPGHLVVLRRPFEQFTDPTGAPRVDTKTGEFIYVADAVTPGRLISRFGTDDTPDTLRLRVLGRDPGYGAGTICRLSGRTTLTAWYTKTRGSAAASNLTLTAERVDAAPGAQFVNSGGIPSELPAAMLLGQRPNGDNGVVLDLMLPWIEGDTYMVEGMAQVGCSTPVPQPLIGSDVTLTNLRTFFTVPDRQDVNQRTKSELVLVCSGVEPVSAMNGRSKKAEPVTVPAAPEKPAEG